MSHQNKPEERAYPQAFDRQHHKFLTRQVVFAFFGLAIIALGLFLVLGRGDDKKGSATTTSKSVESPAKSGVEAVDMGLSVRWASCNVGAESATADGDYFAWGELTPSDSYVWRNSSTYDKILRGDVLPPANDASIQLGEGWRMPTIEEFDELSTRCEWRSLQQDGRYGYEVTGPNGNSIFLPASGYIYDTTLSHGDLEGLYWCSNIATDGDSKHATTFRFNNRERYFESLYRYYGAQVRAVRE